MRAAVACPAGIADFLGGITMSEVKIILPDNSERAYAAGTTLGEAVKQLSNSLAKKVLAADVDGELTDLREEVKDGSKVSFLTFNEQGGKDTLRHSASHIMAQAIKRLWPDAQLAIGPAIENGFYYDIDMEHVLVPEDLAKIEAEMHKIVKANFPIEKEVLSRDEALKFFKEKHENYKVELIEDLPADAEISTYRQGEFVDLCAGPHVASTGKVKAFKLQSLAGAYWRGDEKTKCSNVFTVLLLKRKKNSTNTYIFLKKQLVAITVNWAKNWAYSYSKNRAPASHSSYRKVWLFATNWKTSGVKFTMISTTKKFVPQSS